MKRMLGTHRKYVFLAFVVVFTGLCAFLFTKVETNYDLAEYLPADSNTARGLEILTEEFGNHAFVEIMVGNVGLQEALGLKETIETDEAVLRVVWLDDHADIEKPSEEIDTALLDQYFSDNHALFEVTFAHDAFSPEVEAAIDRIAASLSEHEVHFRGEAFENKEARRIAEGEVMQLILIIVPIAFLILVMAAKSHFEPVLVLLTLSVAVVVNMGTNIVFPHVSYITLTLAAALQLAISLDYSLFYIHRYYEEREKNHSVDESIRNARKKAFPSITASAATTITGFLSLLLMRYGIGKDIGLVLAKGVAFSYLAVFFLLPVLVKVFAGPLEKSLRRSLVPPVASLTGIFAKGRFVFLALFLIAFAGGALLQREVDFTFSSTPAGDVKSVVHNHREAIGEQFHPSRPIVVLVAKGEVSDEVALVSALEDLDNVIGIDALVKLVDPSIPRAFLPSYIREPFVGKDHVRIIVHTDIVEEDEAMYAFDEVLRETVASVYGDGFYLLGMIPATAEIRSFVEADGIRVSLFGAVAIGLIILVIFRSLLIPVLLVALIQASIWVNLSLSGLSGVSPLYIGYLVMFSLQLGATIDYAVLLANRYQEFRLTDDRLKALKKALEKASPPIIISALVLATAGFSEAAFSELASIREIGLLIGRGALLSLGFVIFLLPSLLLVFDGAIQKTTRKRKSPVG